MRDILVTNHRHIAMIEQLHLLEMIIVHKIHTSTNHVNNNSHHHHVQKVKHIVVVMMHLTVKKEEKLIVMLDLTFHQEIFVIHFQHQQHKQHTREMNSLQEGMILLIDATINRYVVTSFHRGEMTSYNQDVTTSNHREGMNSNSLPEERSSHHQHHHGGELINLHLLEMRMNFHLEEARFFLGEMNFQEDHERNFHHIQERNFHHIQEIMHRHLDEMNTRERIHLHDHQ